MASMVMAERTGGTRQPPAASRWDAWVAPPYRAAPQAGRGWPVQTRGRRSSGAYMTTIEPGTYPAGSRVGRSRGFPARSRRRGGVPGCSPISPIPLAADSAGACPAAAGLPEVACIGVVVRALDLLAVLVATTQATGGEVIAVVGVDPVAVADRVGACPDRSCQSGATRADAGAAELAGRPRRAVIDKRSLPVPGPLQSSAEG